MKPQVNSNKTRKKISQGKRDTRIQERIHKMKKYPHACRIYTQDPKTKQVLVCAYRAIYPGEIKTHKDNHRRSIQTSWNKAREYEIRFEEYKKLHRMHTTKPETKPVAAPSLLTTQAALATATTPKHFIVNFTAAELATDTILTIPTEDDFPNVSSILPEDVLMDQVIDSSCSGEAKHHEYLDENSTDSNCDLHRDLHSNDIFASTFVKSFHDHIYAEALAHVDADIDATESCQLGCQSNIADISLEVLASETSNHLGNHSSSHSSSHSWITLPHSPSPRLSQLKNSYQDSFSTPKKSLNAIFPHATPP